MTLEHISCGHMRTMGERRLRDFLGRHLQDGVLLSNCNLLFNNGSLEHDFVLINKQGVWLLEEKGWTGTTIVEPTQFVRSDKSIKRRIIETLEHKAKVFHGALEYERFSNISVVGILVLSSPGAKWTTSSKFAVRLEPFTRRIFTILDENWEDDTELIDVVEGRKGDYLFHSSNRQLTSELIDQIKEMLDEKRRQPGPQIVQGFRLLRDLDLGDEEIFIAYEGQHAKFPDFHVRIKKYEIKDFMTIRSYQDLKRAKQRFQRGMTALTKLASHPNIVHPHGYWEDPESDDIFWMIVEWVKGKTLLERVREGPIPYEEQLHIIRGIVDGLEYCHRHGIIHRNLKPSSIYIANDNTIKLDDFDNAQISGMHTAVSTKSRPRTNRYTADEVIVNPHNASVQSDLYSLGIIWHDMAIGITTDLTMFSKLKEATIPGKAAELIRQLAASGRDNRPESAIKVKERLQEL